jgi:hypothetical protein
MKEGFSSATLRELGSEEEPFGHEILRHRSTVERLGLP